MPVNRRWTLTFVGAMVTLTSGARHVEATAQPISGGARMSMTVADFDDDGFGDVAMGFPSRDGTGSVEIHYAPGGPSGVSDVQQLRPGNGGLPATLGPGDRFGASLAAADFDGDGDVDLAVGAPADDVGVHVDAGSVIVFEGSDDGPLASPAEIWSGGSPGLLSSSEDGEAFGSSLVAADFGNGHYPDLAIGVPGEDTGETKPGEEQQHRDAGAVVVLYGSSEGVAAANSDQWHGSTNGMQSNGEAGDAFGAALAAGDFNGDVLEDLAIGVPGEDVIIDSEQVDAVDAGAVNVLHGSATGLVVAGNQQWHGQSPGLDGDAEGDDRFGTALAAGDFDKNGMDDLAIGAPGEDAYGSGDAGAVVMLYGASGTGLATDHAPDQWHGRNTIGGTEPNDRFGDALAAGNFDRDPPSDLAVGVPGKYVDAAVDAGAVVALYGTVDVGLGGANATIWDDSELGEAPEGNDGLGTALAAGALNADGFDDLAIGVPGETAAQFRFLNGSSQRLVHNSRPTASFSVENCRTQTCHFVDESEDDGPLTSLWDFGDGETSTEQSPHHFYETGDVRTVTLTVTDSFGASSTWTETVTPFNESPTAAFTWRCLRSKPVCTFVVAKSTEDPDGTITRYEWRFGDGSTRVRSDSETMRHRYARAGKYHVELTVTDEAGATGTARKEPRAWELHERRIAFSMRRWGDGRLHVQGRVIVGDGFEPCRTGVRVRIWLRFGDDWRNANTFTRSGKLLKAYVSTAKDGRFETYVNDNAGRWRATIPTSKVQLDRCSSARAYWTHGH